MSLGFAPHVCHRVTTAIVIISRPRNRELCDRDGGVQLSFGSDMPGEPTFDPLLSIHYVVNRSGPERIKAREALACYTLGSAYAEFKEDEKGTITAGKLADLTILTEDPLTVKPERIKEVKVTRTIVGGEVVYEADGS